MEKEGLSEEEMIDSLFYQCDVHDDGKVQINTIIQFLKNCLGNENNEPDLVELAAILEEESNEGNINFTAYRNGVKQWITEIRQRCESTSFLDPDGLIMGSDTEDGIGTTAHHDGLSGCIETSGIGDGPFRNEQDLGDLLGQLEDLKFQNRKLVEENMKLLCQLESQEETASALASDIQFRRQDEEQLRKKVKSLQELVDFRQAVMEENEELKNKMARLKERKKELENKVMSLERDNMNLENQTRSLENKWQKVQQELDLRKKELQEMQNTCAEQKVLLLKTQELKNSKETLLTEKCNELSDLKEKFQELVESNEKLEDERDNIQTLLSDAQVKLQRLQNIGAGVTSVTNEDGITPNIVKLSPKHGYRTPLSRNSICMELKDRLDESKHLPSPLCEKKEISKDLSVFMRPAILTPYMSAWELDVTNGSVPDYSLELLELTTNIQTLVSCVLLKRIGHAWFLTSRTVMKSRRGRSFGLCEADIEKKILGLRKLEKDALHKEIIKLYRLNVDLAEKCHRAEVREEELHEMVSQANKTVDLDKQNIHKLEESLHISQAAREVDLKDLWRLVQADVENECFDSQSDSSEFGSSEHLKHQITQEIEALKNRLHKQEAALGALSCTQGKLTLTRGKEGAGASSPLVDALAIDLPVVKRHQERKSVRDQTPCKDCRRSNKHRQALGSKSVPLLRKNNRIHDIRSPLNLSSSSSTSGIGDLDYNNSSVLTVNRKNIPRINLPTGDSESQVSQSIDSNATDSDNSIKPVNPNVEDTMNATKNDNPNPLGHISTEGQVLRRRSYTTAINNETSSVEEVHIPRSRSYSFQTAIEQGQISPTGPPQMVSTSSMGDTTPENETTESSWNNVPPRFSSTPLPDAKPPTKSAVFHPHTVKPYTSNNKNVPDPGVQKQSVNGMSKKDTENHETDKNLKELKKSQDIHPSKSISLSLQTELTETGNFKDNKSVCSSNQLSVLFEEDTHGTSNSSRRSSPSRSGSDSHPAQHVSSFLTSSGAPGSAEFWTLSRSSDRQNDSSHSSAVTNSSSFQIRNSSPEVSGSTDLSNRMGSNSLLPETSVSSPERSSSSSASAKLQNLSTSPKFTSSKLQDPAVSSALPKISLTVPKTVSCPVSSHAKLASSTSSRLFKSLGPENVSDAEKVHSSFSSNQSAMYREKPTIPSPNSPRQTVCTKSDFVVPVKVSKPVMNSEKLSPVLYIPPNSTNNNELVVVETTFPSKRTTLDSSCLQQSQSVVEHSSAFEKGDSELLADLTNSLSCMTLDSPPKTGKDTATRQNGTVKAHSSPDVSAAPKMSPISPANASGSNDECGASKTSGNVHNTSIYVQGYDITNLRDAVRDIQEMVRDPPPPAGSMSVGSSSSSKVSSSADSRLSSVSSSSSERTATHTNNNYKPSRQTQMIVEDDEDLLSRDQQSESSLSKIRENHLARRRDQLRTRMPQLSELAEKDGAALQNGLGEGEEKLEVIQPPLPNDDPVMPSVPDEFLSKLGLTQNDPSSDELSDQEIESKFTSLSLAFKTDSQTLEKRLEIQERSRDIAEQNVDKELQGLRTGLATLNQICTDPQVREVLTKIQNHIDILEKSTARVSSRAEVLGAIQQEKRMSKAVDIMVHHVENLRRVHEREHAELEEAKKLLQDSRSLGPSAIDIAGNERMLSRRSASVCPNNMLPGQSSRRRVSEIALPKVLGGTGAPNLHISSSMDSPFSPEFKPQRTPSPLRMENSIDEDEDAKSRFQAVVASTAFKSTVANTLRRASLERQNPVQQSSTSTPDISRDNSQDVTADAQEKEKQKNLEEEAFKKGYEQGMRASLGKDLSSLREQQNQINQSLGDIMDSIDNHMEEPKSLKEILLARADSLVPKIKISGWRIRMTFGCFFIVMAIISVIVSLFPVGSASLVGFRHYGRPPS